MSARRMPAIALPSERVAAWRLARQRLPAADGAGSPEQVARDLVGVQAQVLSAASLAIAIRSQGGRVTDAPTALAERRLVRSWSMRGTLHLFAADDYPVIVAAIGRREHWRRPKWLDWFGVTELELEAAIEMVGEILDDGRPRSRAELNQDLLARLGPRFGNVMRSSWGTFLNLATNRGYLCHAVSDDSAVRFVRPRRWLESWRVVDGDEALRTCIERYLAAYGPASLREIARWWGLENQRDLAPIIASLGEHVSVVDVDGERGWIRSADLPEIEAAEPPDGAVHLVGTFDPLIVGGGLRNHLLPAEHLTRVARTAGWISPVVLVDGSAAGVWDSTRTGDRLNITIDPFQPFDRARKVAVALAAERVAEAQGAVAIIGYGPVFAAPHQRPPGA